MLIHTHVVGINRMHDAGAYAIAAGEKLLDEGEHLLCFTMELLGQPHVGFVDGHLISEIL